MSVECIFVDERFRALFAWIWLVSSVSRQMKLERSFGRHLAVTNRAAPVTLGVHLHVTVEHVLHKSFVADAAENSLPVSWVFVLAVMSTFFVEIVELSVTETAVAYIISSVVYLRALSLLLRAIVFCQAVSGVEVIATILANKAVLFHVQTNVAHERLL